MIGRRTAAAFLLALVTAAGPAGGAVAAEANTGVQVAEYYVQPSVDLLKRLGIISGDPDGNMRLGATVTRAELAKILVAAMGQGDTAMNLQDQAPSFPDIQGHWARGYITVARQLGIVGGYGDGTFRPNSPVTNAEALTMLLRACGLRPVGAWPQAYLEAARKAGILTDSLARALPSDGQAVRGAVFLLAERGFTMVTDAAGRNLIQRTFGTAPPRLSVTVPGSENGIVSSPAATIQISAPGAIMVQVNGRPAVRDPGGFVATVPMAAGINELVVLAVDPVGITAQQRIVLIRK